MDTESQIDPSLPKLHLHGHAFSVAKSISGPENYINPPQRDVVGVGCEYLPRHCEKHPELGHFLRLTGWFSFISKPIILDLGSCITTSVSCSVNFVVNRTLIHDTHPNWLPPDWHLEAGLAVVFAKAPNDNDQVPSLKSSNYGSAERFCTTSNTNRGESN